MAIVTEKPKDLPSSNDLDNVVDPDENDAEPAYLSFGSTPTAMRNPPEVGETRTYVVRVECTGQSESVRTDGEHRYGRKLSVLWAVEKGKAEPPDPGADQPGLFDEDDEDDEPEQDEDDPELDDEACGRPPFLDGTE
ncbi:MAG: hypothetical protein M3Y90_15540 [Actinomycetota bacterium]|nr:hypothetical protein [Actinomycetota bacterium]